MTFVPKSHEFFYVAVAAAIIVSAVVIVSANIPQKQIQTSKASQGESNPSSDPMNEQLYMENGY